MLDHFYYSTLSYYNYNRIYSIGRFTTASVWIGIITDSTEIFFSQPSFQLSSGFGWRVVTEAVVLILSAVAFVIEELSSVRVVYFWCTLEEWATKLPDTEKCAVFLKLCIRNFDLRFSDAWV